MCSMQFDALMGTSAWYTNEPTLLCMMEILEISSLVSLECVA